MSTTEEETRKLYQLEQKMNIKLQGLKEFIDKVYIQYLPYLNAIQSSMQTLWQYPQFRLAMYIFGILSAIPIGIFLLFISIIILTTSIILCVIWSTIVFSTAAFGLIILIPILLSFILMIVFLIISYDIYQHLLQLRKQANKE